MELAKVVFEKIYKVMHNVVILTKSMSFMESP